MSFLEAIILGIIQGATEFLPISSSGHLMLGEFVLGFEEPNLLLNVVLHIGTLAAVVLFYRKDVYDVVVDVWGATVTGVKERSIAAFREKEGARLAVLLVLATIPTAVIGLLLHPYVSTSALEDVTYLPHFILAMLIVNGFILLSAKFRDEDSVEEGGKWTLWNITPTVAILLGVVQGLAVLPGVSRSGLTIVAALWLGVHRVKAARFSFLLAIPAVLGAMVVESVQSFDSEALTGSGAMTEIAIYSAAAAVAGIIGYLSIVLLVNMLRKANFWHFAWYCWFVGIAGLIWLMV